MDPEVLSRYNSDEGARSYRDEYRKKFHRKYSDHLERNLFRRLFSRIGPLKSLLDVPCGWGRLRSLFLEGAELVCEGDWSFPMLRDNKGLHGGDGATPFVRMTALRLPVGDRSFDCVVSLRLNHHIDDLAERERHLRELMRVADRFVIVSYLSFHSLKNFLRRIRRPFNRKRRKNTLKTSKVVQIAEEEGFDMVNAPALSLIGSGHRYALLRRKE